MFAHNRQVYFSTEQVIQTLDIKLFTDSFKAPSITPLRFNQSRQLAYNISLSYLKLFVFSSQ